MPLADMEDLCLVLDMVIPPKFKVLDFDKYKGKMMEACLWGFYGGWIFELQRGLLMVIFHHGDAAEDKGEEVRGGAIR